MLLMRRQEIPVRQEGRESAFFSYMECTPAIDGVDRAPGYVPPIWSMADEVDHSLQWQRRRTSRRRVSAGEWIGIQDMKIIEVTFYVVPANFSGVPFSLEQAWPLGWYYMRRFCHSPHYLHTEESSLYGYFSTQPCTGKAVVPKRIVHC